jgi:hypothetical protein
LRIPPPQRPKMARDFSSKSINMPSAGRQMGEY